MENGSAALLTHHRPFCWVTAITRGVIRVTKNFQPLPSDVIVASFPKTGTTWLKALLYSIVNRSSKHRLTVENPHSLVPFLEYFDTDGKPPYESKTALPPDINHSRRIFSTHMPYQLLAKTLDSLACRVVYVTRNPKDTLVSSWHFVKKKLSLERPKRAHFLTYEELKNDPQTHVKKLAEFLGCPLKAMMWRGRNGVVGGYKDHLSDEIVEKIDALTREKFHSLGFMYGI
ncbi:UNVERIFIED_CONTAM: Cytosolic sulfotransferase 6 [Sesamum angustifolium]|uniref:Sulfotransferase n=1 Tax=Sesamum angustifolium TaxID=2727405 RepID=A0AAW2IXS9_9LAMI